MSGSRLRSWNKKSASPEDGDAPMATLPPGKGGGDGGEPTMTKTKKQAEILQEENRELKALGLGGKI